MLIQFPSKFYEKCNINSSEHLFFIVTGDNLYEKKNVIDSMVVKEALKEKSITITLYKEGWGIDSTNFGQDIEPFGSEWESYLGDYRYAVYQISNNEIQRKQLYDKRKLIELNGKKIN
ncbi:hypothetical protein [Brumimicrobium mesophilum]|uniref:hypothetical protein n=1 Tax=Brumimicrobium mesophilum TaxID=392717 RepID=UPI00131E03F4|nr:hypothetical protein [Brumimicrobium mesophilum]